MALAVGTGRPTEFSRTASVAPPAGLELGVHNWQSDRPGIGGSGARGSGGPAGFPGEVRSYAEPTESPSRRSPNTNESGAGWPGVNSSQCGCDVPDPSLAVGGGLVVEATSGSIEVWTVAGIPQDRQTLPSFFALPASTPLEEPAVAFDNLTEEWFATAVDPSNDTFVLAAGTSPLAGAVRFDYFVPSYPNERPDLPSMSVSEWMVGIAANDVNLTTGNLDGTGYTLLNRSDLFDGTLYFYNANPQEWLPNGDADSLLTPSPDQWFGGVTSTPSPLAYWVRWSSAPPALPVYESDGPSIATFSASPPSAQLGSADLLNTSEGNDGRVDSAIWENGRETLVFSTGTGCESSASCVTLVQVDTTTGALRQDLAVGSPDYAMFDPSVAADADGDLTVTSTFSSASTYPSVLVFGQAGNEPNSTAAGTYVAVPGTAPVTADCNASGVCPFGWTSASAAGPATAVVWSAAEFGTTAGGWATWVQPTTTRNASLVLTASPAAVDLGQSIDLRALGSGGTSALADFRWGGLPPGCSSGTVPEFTCVPSQVGVFDVRATGNDSYPTFVTSTTTVTVLADPSVSPPTANASGADAGQYRTFSTSVQFGISPYRYNWSGLPLRNCTNATTSAVSCELTSSGPLSVAVAVQDATGIEVSSDALSFLVSPTLELLGLDAFNDTGAGGVGGPVTFEVSVEGGAPPLEYGWQGLPGPCGSTTQAAVVCAPSAPGSYEITVRVTDANGAEATAGPLGWAVPAPARGARAAGPFGLPGEEGWGLLGGLIAVGTLGGVVWVVHRSRRHPGSPTKDGPADDEELEPPVA
jgi:hypothetical protein